MGLIRRQRLAGTASRATSLQAYPPCTRLQVSAFSPSISYENLGRLTDTVTVYSNIGKKHPLEWASTILALLAFLVTIPIYVFYWKGPIIREKSKFAQVLASDRKAAGGTSVSVADVDKLKTDDEESHVEKA